MSREPAGDSDAPAIVERLLGEAASRRASDLHVEPTAQGAEIRLRVDGLLETLETVSLEAGRAIVLRLMVLAHLLTYRLDVPQEGRIDWTPPAAPATAARPSRALDLRLAVMPTVHGLRAAVRLPADLLQPRALEELQLPTVVLQGLQAYASSDAGMLLLVGPAGSGKTTTIYALLAHIVARSPGTSVIALEDPVERHVPGVTQIAVQPFGELTYDRALKSILRQDPQVLMVGEIRDAATASLALQAALSGHRLVSTLHAGDPASAIARLLEMGLEPYQVAGAVHGVIGQRLLRRREADGQYRGRVPVGEIALLDEPLRQAILRRADLVDLRRALERQPGFISLRGQAEELVRRGVTDEAEVRRVLGV